MDPFGDLVRGLRSHGSLFGSTTLTPPWSLHFVDGAPLTLCAMLTGAGWILVPGADPVRLHPGEQTLVLSGDVVDLGDGVTVAFEELP